jgi:hypothetical protein
MAHARTDVPRLLAEIERLHAVLAQQFPRHDGRLAGPVPASESR